MAISRQQPMRPALSDVLDGVDRLDTEAEARRTADTALGDRITAKTTARETADTALGGRIDDEVTARQNADTTLGQRITDEETSRRNNDSALHTAINGVRSTLSILRDTIGGDYDDENTIADAIADLDARVTALEGA